MRALLLTGLLLCLAGCTGIPDGLEPVTGFEAERYLGRWYEIARLDHSFERGMSNVTADYSRPEDGSIVVKNRGFIDDDGEWDDIEGSATFQGAEDVGSLTVLFFWPFYAGYHVVALDPDYGWAMVSGPSRSYLWFLAREPTLAEDVRADLVAKAKGWGFPTDELIWVEHDRAEGKTEQAPESGAGN